MSRSSIPRALRREVQRRDADRCLYCRMSMPVDEPQSPWVDPIVAEVRTARERIVAAVGGDLHLLCEQLRDRQAAAGRLPCDTLQDHRDWKPAKRNSEGERQVRPANRHGLDLSSPSSPDCERRESSPVAPAVRWSAWDTDLRPPSAYHHGRLLAETTKKGLGGTLYATPREQCDLVSD